MRQKMFQPFWKMKWEEKQNPGPGLLGATCVRSEEQKVNRQTASEKEIKETGVS